MAQSNQSKLAEENLYQLKITADNIDDYKEAFDLFDSNQDGLLAEEDFGRVMTSLGVKFTPDELKRFTAKITRDDGKITFYDFIKLVIQHGVEEDEEENLYEAFKIFDKDGDGFITHKELKIAMEKFGEKLTDKETRDMIKLVDINCDGKIDYGEFVVLMMN